MRTRVVHRGVGAEWRRYLPETGYLLVAAVADEGCGFTRAVLRIRDWCADLPRFPEQWVHAVEAR
jgi:hypothetical protein